MVKWIKCFALTVMLSMAFGVTGQVTTSSIQVLVTDDADEPLIGATVKAIHKPSGSKYNAVSNLDGRAYMQGLRTGGPYEVEVTYVGYQLRRVEGVVLQLGNTYNLSVHLSPMANELSEVVVSGVAGQIGRAHV